MWRKKSFQGFGLVMLVVFSLGGGIALAQSEPATSPATGTGDSSAVKGVDRTIYIPFKDLNATLGSPSAKIVLPYKTYQELRDLVRARQAEQAEPGVVLTGSSYAIVAEENFAQVTMDLKLEVLRAGALLTLPLGDAAIASITGPDGLLLRGTGEGNYLLSLPKAGSHDVQLRLAVRVNQSPSGREVVLKTPIAAVTEVEVTVPQSEQAFEFSPTGVQLPVEKEAEGQVTRSKALLGATSQIQVRWHSAASHAPEMNLLASASSQTLVTIADGRIHTHSWLSYDVLRGELSQVRVALPVGLRLLDVSSENQIRNWKVDKKETSQIVTIDLVQPAIKQLKLELDAEESFDSNEITLGGLNGEGKASGIQPLDVIRVSGQLAIRHGADLAVNVQSQQGVIRINSTEAAPQLTGNNALLFRFFTTDYALSLTAEAVKPRINVLQQTKVMLREEDLELQETLRYQVERIGIFSLSIQVPDQVTIDSVQGSQVKSFAVQDGVLSVSLNAQTIGEIRLLVTGRRALGAAKSEEFPLPVSTPLGVEREEGMVLVYAKESLEVQTALQNVQSAQPMPIRQDTREGNLSLVSAWNYFRRPVVIPVRLLQKPARLSAEVATTINVQPEISRVQTQLTYSVELSPLNTFRFEVPESISGRLQIDVANGLGASVPIRQKIPSDPVDGKVIWTVTTQRELVGKETLNISYDAPTVISSGGESDAGMVFPVPRPLGLVDADGNITTPLVSLDGEVSLQKDRTLSISAIPGETLEQIDHRELKLLPKSGSLAYRYFRDEPEHPATLSVSAQKFEVQNVVSTIVSKGLVEVVASQDAQATYRCRYLVQSSERQRLLVAMPDHLEVLGIFVNDREVKLEKAEASLPDQMKLMTPYWLNVSRAESSDSAFLLTFQFLWNIRPALGESQFGSGTLQLPLPVIDVQGSGVVQEQKVVVWVPEKYTLVGNPESFRLQTARTRLRFLRGERPDRNTGSLENWVTNGKSAPNGFAQFPTEGRQPYIYSTLGQVSQIEIRWWHRLGMTMIFSLAAALIGWILRKTSWENRLGLLLFFAFAAALYGLSDSASLYQAVSASRWGLGLMLGIWILHSLFVHPNGRSNGTSETSHSEPPPAAPATGPEPQPTA